LQVSVLLDAPEPGLRHKIEQAIADKYVRLARIDTRYPAQKNPATSGLMQSPDPLQTLRPVDVFKRVYESRYANEVPVELMALFNEVAQQVYEKERGEA